MSVGKHHHALTIGMGGLSGSARRGTSTTHHTRTRNNLRFDVEDPKRGNRWLVFLHISESDGKWPARIGYSVPLSEVDSRRGRGPRTNTGQPPAENGPATDKHGSRPPGKRCSGFQRRCTGDTPAMRKGPRVSFLGRSAENFQKPS